MSVRHDHSSVRPADTSEEAFDAQISAARRMPAALRLELALEMSDELAGVAAAGARSRALSPDAE